MSTIHADALSMSSRIASAPESVPLPEKETDHHAQNNKTEPTMAKQFHQHAQEDTPSKVSVPENWPGIIMWAMGRHGPVVLFVVATWFLYNDNKVMQQQMLDVAKAQIAVNSQVVLQMSETKIAIEELVEEAKRAHRQSQ